MTEEFLHYLWEFRLIDSEINTISGEPVIILHPGQHNSNGGPDFINSRIRIGGMLWAGNVEIHVQQGDWFRHKHHLDPVYEHIILHVVYSNDEPPDEKLPETFPTTIIKDHFPESIYHKYTDLLENIKWIPCQSTIGNIEPFCFEQWSTALIVERLVQRSEELKKLWMMNQFDWEETFYQGLAQSFGITLNTLPFELLSKALPTKILLKYIQQPFQIEALVFGQAGMLNRAFTDDYSCSLKKEYDFLSAKHGLIPIEASLWKFLRIRPPGFPTIRLAQWAVLLKQCNTLFSELIECKKREELMKIFSVQASAYWDIHYLFEKRSPGKPKIFGESAIHLLIINFVAPFLFFYGEEMRNDDFKERSISFLEQLPGEKNTITGKWKNLGLPVDNALKTQALLQLKKHYCDDKKCLECRIGRKILTI